VELTVAASYSNQHAMFDLVSDGAGIPSMTHVQSLQISAFLSRRQHGVSHKRIADAAMRHAFLQAT
jgi:hypothetical protein